MSAGLLSIIFAIAFLLILTLLHFLKPELDPSWRMISEYEIGRFGWLMRLAFFCWGASVLTLLIAIWPSLLSLSGAISRGWFILIVLALIGAGIFITDPITALTSSPSNNLHRLCGSIVILTFPIAATLAVHSLLKNAAWQTAQGWLILVTVLAWLGMLAYFASIIISRAKNPKAGEAGGPSILQGWPNRVMVVLYMIWLITLASIALSR